MGIKNIGRIYPTYISSCVYWCFMSGCFFDRTPTTASAGGRFGGQQLFDQLDLTDIQPFVAGGQRRYVIVVVVVVVVFVAVVVACTLHFVYYFTFHICAKHAAATTAFCVQLYLVGTYYIGIVQLVLYDSRVNVFKFCYYFVSLAPPRCNVILCCIFLFFSIFFFCTLFVNAPIFVFIVCKL